MSSLRQTATALAPSNIALVKYMGKSNAQANRPTNSSLSFTLPHLATKVRVSWKAAPAAGSAVPHGEFEWRPLVEQGWLAPKLSAKGSDRFLQHAERVLQHYNVTGGNLIVESANNFPSDCGLASSASSFAALTLALGELIGLDVNEAYTRRSLADLSRQGSGSSIRSFFGPWTIWAAEGAGEFAGLPVAERIRHVAIVADDKIKRVSSSEAHLRVPSSMLFRGRPERAEERLRLVLDHLRRAQGADGVHAWNRAVHLVGAEFWDMHALFESAEPPFGYFVPESIAVLNAIREISEEFLQERDFREPMVTMDAGPNVHVLYWRDQWTDELLKRLKVRMAGRVKIIDADEDSSLRWKR